MILSPIDRPALSGLLLDFSRAVADVPLASAVLRRIALVMPEGDYLSLSTDPRHHAQAVDLCTAFGLATIDIDPKAYFTWDGKAVATGMEPSVIIHEVGHYQCAAPSRRRLPDFGLGAGPETGRRAEANAVQTVFGVEADIEEGLASLLGILWEAALGQPALLAFVEQNWLEGGASPHNRNHFVKMVDRLAKLRLIDASGHPTHALRHQEDAEFFPAWR
jgi:elongation factor P hydroxylase